VSRRVGQAAGKLRIIGGSLRGSRLSVPEIPGLRPTPDRVRETLFNWLMPVIAGAHCLDLYAGTGALGIEALSRGAASATFVESDARLVEQLRANLSRLKLEAPVFQGDALRFLTQGDGQYNLVFVDPPFTERAWSDVARALESNRRLSGNALVYVESPAGQSLDLPQAWQLHRQARAGAVCYALYRRE